MVGRWVREKSSFEAFSINLPYAWKKNMTENCKFEVVSWEKVYNMLLSLARKIEDDDFKPDLIIGVCRGGWLPTRVLSDLLENPCMTSVRVEFYSGVAEKKKKPRITQPIFVNVKGKRVLVVDDVTDTGRSLCLVKSHLNELGAKEIRLATLYHKPWSTITPDYYEKKTQRWIVFPWERRETVRNLIKKYGRQGKTVKEAKEKLVKSGLSRKIVEYFTEELGEGNI
jgi:hypoxanthine phosphoribosyltransferase